MKNKRIIIVILLVICIGFIGFTYAYFFNSTQLENEFKSKQFGATFNETFESPGDWKPGDTTEKRVFVTNNNDVDMAVRVSFTETWEATDGTTLSNTQNDESVAIINFSNTRDWIKIGNYYYYKYRLKKNEATSDFMNSVTFNENVDFSVSCTTNNNSNISNCIYSTGDYLGASYTLNITIETIQFDNYKDIWGSNIELLNEKPLTGVQSLVKKSNSNSITNYTDGDIHEMYAFNHAVTDQTPALTDYRYIGGNPYNYVYFNCDDPQEGVEYNYDNSCEKWRIIGVFDVDDGTGNVEQRMKLVRGSEFANSMLFNSSYNNDWTVSTLNIFLNGDYYNRTGNAATYGLKSSAKNMIGDAVYYLGALSFNSGFGTTEKIYGEERGTTVCGACNSDTTKIIWTGKVGLMYPSDEYMVYGNGVNATCYDNPSGCNETNARKGWVFNSNKREGNSIIDNTWLLSSYAGDSYDVMRAFSQGYLHYYFSAAVSSRTWVRPVVYLSSDVMIESGTGRENDPYVLSK